MTYRLSYLLTILPLLVTCASGDRPPSIFDTSLIPEKACHGHLTTGHPSQPDKVLCRLGYAVGYNYRNKVPDWVVYYVTADSVTVSMDRKDTFQEDESIPVGFRATLDDYVGSGYDRGHLAPRATVDFSAEAMDQSYLMSNISPQLPEFNRGTWRTLESYIRDCSVEKGELYVISGPIYKTDTPDTIGKGVAVPDGYFKVIFDATGPGAVAFSLPHRALSGVSLGNYITSVDAVEQATGLDFLSVVIDSIEERIETQTTPLCALAPASLQNKVQPIDTTCGSKRTCSEMTSCEEARFYLQSCGVTSLDRDKDGVPCESLCR